MAFLMFIDGAASADECGCMRMDADGCVVSLVVSRRDNIAFVMRQIVESSHGPFACQRCLCVERPAELRK